MTDNGEITPWLPGQSPVAGVRYAPLVLPGINDQQQTEDRYGLGAPKAPYGMLPGQRHVLPDQINLDPQPVKPDQINLDEAPDPGFGNRADGTPKGNGFLGVLKRPDGNVSTELSIGVNIGGREVEIPSLVPTLTPQERQLLLSLPDGDASKIPQSIVDKATAFARQRLAAGKSPFASSEESPTQGPAPAGPGVLPQTHSVRSFRVTNDKGETVAELPDNPTAGSGNDYYKSKIQAMGDALGSQAVNPADKAAAATATQFGMSLIGLMPIKDIESAVLHHYEADERNVISRETQAAKTARAGHGGGGGPPPGGPTKGDMASHKLSQDMWGLVNGIVDKDRGATKYAAISEQENAVAEGLKLLSQPNAMAQRVEVQRALLELTGKASRESEQTALTGAAGKWNELANKLSLWTSDDPQLSKQYIDQFKGMLMAQQAYISEQKDLLGRETAAAVFKETGNQDAADAAYGRMTGRQAAAYVPPHERGAAQPASPAPTGGAAVSPHLQKYLKK